MNLALYSFANFIYDYEYIKLNGFLRFVLSDRAALFYTFAVLWIVFSYILGALNFAILLSKHVYHDDIRNHGSGNAGFTNMNRVFGKRAAVLVIVGDVLKTVISVGGAMLLFGSGIASMAGLACILGHCFPCFYGFKGGKGVAATAGMVLILDPASFVVLFTFFVLIVLASKYISLGSVMTVILYPLVNRSIYNFLHGKVFPQYFYNHGLYTEIETLNGAVTDIPSTVSTLSHTLPSTTLLVGIFLAVFVVYMHRANIRRIMRGEESRFSFRKKNTLAPSPEVLEEGRKSYHRIDALDEELSDNEKK